MSEEAVYVDASEVCRATMMRRRILEASARCFRSYGFHAASMAQIASAAHLSVGQIYRHFENKEAIIAAIVEEDLEKFGRDVADLAAAHDGKVAKIVDQLEGVIHSCLVSDRKAIMLEVRAEAARNPKIAAMMASADEAFTRHLRTLLAATPVGALPPAELDCRVEMIRIIFEGAVMRLHASRDRCVARSPRAGLDALIRKALMGALELKPQS